MNNTTKEIKTTIQTAFGEMTRHTTYTMQVIKVKGGIYLSDRSLANDFMFIDEVTDLYIAGQSYADIEVDGKKISYDILLEFFDEKDMPILPKDIDRVFLKDIIRMEMLDMSYGECTVWKKEADLFVNSKKIEVKNFEQKQ